jgi:hypothetical protein
MNESSLRCSGTRTGRGRALLRLVPAILTAALLAPAALAQTNSTQSLSSNRWLFVVDTSRVMQHRAEPIRQIAATLLANGMNGQMRRGDTVGLWTYDAELHAGKFPVHTWTPENSRAFARDVLGFLQTQKFEKESRLGQVVPRWNIVVSNSAILTIILISGGEEKIKGTPFDDAINDIYEGWRDQQEKAHMPFVTFLRAEHGRITNQKVNMPPWPLELPPLFQPQVHGKTAAPPSTVPPLIVTGRKSSLDQTQDVSRPAGVNAPPAVLATNSSTAGTEKTSAATEIKPSTAPENAAEIPKATIAADAGAKAAEPTTQPAEKSGERSVPTVASPPKSEIAAPAATKPETIATSSSARSNSAVAQSSTATGALEATTPAPSGSFLQRNLIWIGALVLGGIVSVLIWMMLRRSRSSAPISLITRSLDREKK